MTGARNALVLHGGWEGHHPELLAQHYGGILEAHGFTVTVAAELTPLADPEAMRACDLLLPLWTMGELAPEQERGLVTAVRAGTGLVGVHCSGDAFRAATDYQHALGGQFVWHPPHATTFVVQFTDPRDQLTEGLEAFTVSGEQYHLHVDPAVEVLAYAELDGDRPEPVAMPMAWKRHHGRGRVFYCAVGHAFAEHEIPAMRTLMSRALQWAARE